jgi:hypothetical protein
VRRINGVTRILAIVAAAVAVAAVAFTAGSADVNSATTRPLVVVVSQGGLCWAGDSCRHVARITDTTISSEGFVARRLRPDERRALLRAMRELDVSYLRKHPFTGACPTISDGPESTYRFRGFVPRIPACTYDVRGIRAVRLTDRLLGSLEPKPR